MKLKSLILSTVLAATPWIVSAQSAKNIDMKDVTNNLDMDGQFFMANNIEGDLSKLAALGTDFAQNSAKNGTSCLPEEMDFNAILKDFGMDQLVAYGRSAKFEGDHWVSKMYLQNNGSKKGIYSMMGESNTTYQAINFAPSGTDMVMEWSVDTRQLMNSMKNVPKCERLDEFMSGKMPAGGTVEEMLNTFTAKVSLAVKLDDKKREVCPVYPEYTFPKMHGCMRMEGANQMWKQVGGMAGFMMKVEKQDDGTLMLTPRKQKKNMNVVMLMDTKNDLLWAATSRKFLAECRGDGAKLAADADFKTISEGSTKGNAIVYISNQACLEIRQVKEAKYNKMGKKYLSDEMIEKIMNHLTESKNGYYAEMRKSKNGINFVLKAPCPVKEIMGVKRGGKKGGKKSKSGCPYSEGSQSPEGKAKPDDAPKPTPGGDEGDM
jgi:hypothetical protein|tara:strand:- start:3382 stop:4680 length:1299 start_codon:yes stop_codon:yes gene_type:complete